MSAYPSEGEWFYGLLLETCRDLDRSISRPRVRPIEVLPPDMRVEFPRNLRERNPIGTRFRADVKVCQKHLSDGSPKGPPYLRADTDTIRKADYTPDQIIFAVRKAGTISGRAYEYVLEFGNPATTRSFSQLRQIAYSVASATVSAQRREKFERERNDLIGEYALARSKGNCEACNEPAPFLRRNNKPYLEIHHIVALSAGGADHPMNVAAVCPNCHQRTTHSKDASTFNAQIRRKVETTESDLGSLA
jgi:5-methylcytosine-specific restriction endonuclease McrA